MYHLCILYARLEILLLLLSSLLATHKDLGPEIRHLPYAAHASNIYHEEGPPTVVRVKKLSRTANDVRKNMPKSECPTPGITIL